MSKITVKSTKEQMTSYLNEVFKSVKKANKNLADRIVYTSKAYKKDPASVMKKDLYDLCKEAMALNLTPATPVVAEASVKPVKKTGGVTKAKKEAESVKEEAETPSEETPVKQEKAPAKKVGKKKAVTKKSAKKEEPVVKSSEQKVKDPSKNYQPEVILAEQFKEKIVSETLGTLEIAHDIKTIEDLKKSYENEEVIIFAFWWTPRHIRQFSYGEDFALTTVPKAFKDDLDLGQLIYLGDVNPVIVVTSSEYDRPYILCEADLEEFDGIRFIKGCEYQIYRQTAEPQAE